MYTIYFEKWFICNSHPNIITNIITNLLVSGHIDCKSIPGEFLNI